MSDIKNKIKVQPRTLSGFMELLPSQQILFNSMRNKIQESYERFGFLPLNTPIIESSEVLLAKAGGETEKQIYRFTKGDNDLSLRFDLTVPLAKYVAKNYDKLTFPFRRYQIGKVYRGERPQRGRFREFYQCDIDIIGDNELNIINDAEIPSVIYTTFIKLGIDKFTIRINNRKILNGLFEHLNLVDKSKDILITIDKIDKIGKASVEEELIKQDISNQNITTILNFLSISGDNNKKIESLRSLNIKNSLYNQGVNELEQVLKYIEILNVPSNYYIVDLKIARGLDYYTGTVYETLLDEYPNIGSVCSGGRYDNLAEYYTDKKLPGVGISIGLTRLFYQLNELNVISTDKQYISEVLILPMSEDISLCLSVASRLRENGINSEVYSSNKKTKVKFRYADKLNIPYVIVIGDDEIKSENLTLKDMKTGEQLQMDIEQLINVLRK